MSQEDIKYFDAVIGGFPKCGSTTLINYLHQHPEVYVPWDEERDKEIRYEEKDDFFMKNKGEDKKNILGWSI